MPDNLITIEIDPSRPAEYRLTLPQMRLGDLWIILTDIRQRIEDGEFDAGQTKHLDLTTTEPEDDSSDILN